MKHGLLRRSAICALVALAAVTIVSRAHAAKYVVLYKDGIAADAAGTIEGAGGSVVATYPQIGVMIAQSDSPSFGSAVRSDTRVEAAASTARFAVRMEPHGLPVDDFAEPLFTRQWNMQQIQLPEAHAVTGGSPDILVGDIDSGIDFTHPDLAPNVDFANSVDCTSGGPNQDPAAWLDRQGHGTATAGVVAAAANGIGTVGVAPNVRIAAIKSSNDLGLVFPEMVICSFMWAATHGVDVTNNSYTTDPWYFNCRNDREQRAIWTAERRAIQYAIQHGVVVVAAAGNASDDLAHPTRDVISLTYPLGEAQERTVNNSCVVIPLEVPGVIGVAADGSLLRKTFYSNYGLGVIDVTAPSNDFPRTPLAPWQPGGILTPAPANAPCGAFIDPVTGARWCNFGGTSAAAPHVTGVAALVLSRYRHLSSKGVAAVIKRTADPIACPSPATLALYAPFPQLSNGEAQTCTGGADHNSWYGHGQVNAVRALTHQP